MGEKKNEGGNNSKKNAEQKKTDANSSIVLKTDLHCEGCVSKVLKAVRSFQGVEKVTCDMDSNKLMVIGKFDPSTLREKLEQKTHKHVELVSPVPKKDGKGKGGGGGDGGGEAEEKKQNKENKDSKENNKEGKEEKKTKEKEPPTTTTSLKVHLHCQGCIQKIQKIVTKFKGYKEMKIDKQKDMVIVTGSMDVKELVETLKKQLKKEVEIVPSKKEGGEKKEKGGDGGGEKEKGGGKAKGKGSEGKKMDEQGDGGETLMMSNMGNGMPQQMMMMMQQPVQFGYPNPYMHGSVYPVDQFQNPYTVSVHAPQLFSDENPNACSIM